MLQPRSIRRVVRPFVPMLALLAFALCSAVLAPSADALVSAGGGLVETGLDYKGDLDGFTFVDDSRARALVVLSWDKHSTASMALVKSDDAGATWTLSPVGISNLDPWGTSFPTRHGIVVTGKQRSPQTGTWSMVMFTSSDDGATWKRRRLPVPYAYDVQTTDMSHFWLNEYDEGRHPSVFTSADGGKTWTECKLPACTYQGDALKALDAKHAYIKILRKAKPHYLCYVTADGGRSWRRWATVPEAASGGMTLISPTEAWLSVDTGEVRDRSSYLAHTTDGGASWSRIYAGPWGIGGITRSPAGVMFSSGAMWRSSDDGASWTRLRDDVFDYWLNDVVAADDGTLWAAARSTPYAPAILGDDHHGIGLVYRCSDGATWKRVDIPEVRPLRTLDVAGSSVIWAGGWDGAAIRSSDGGATWTSCAVDPNYYFEDIDAVDADTAVAIVGNETEGGFSVLRTTDGGASWSAVAEGSKSDELRAISRLGPDHLLIAGARYGTPRLAVLLESTDGGATWSERTTPCPHSVRDMIFTDADHGWIVASNDGGAFGTVAGSQVLKTSDGGQTWTTTDLGDASTYGLTTVAFGDQQTGWLLGDRILKTTDGGETWTDTGAAVPSSPVGMFTQSEIRGAATVDGQLWAVGADQLILSTVDTDKDTAPPLTGDDGDRLWHNSAVTTHFVASDPGGSGIAGTEYSLDGGAWQPLTGGAVTIEAPADHSADGDHAIEYRSTDAAGNVEFPQLCTVHIDTRAPTTTAGTATVRRGRGATLPYQVTDDPPSGSTATVRITIRTASGQLARRLYLGEQRVNVKTTTTFICRLAAGRYTYAVTAVDTAGNRQSYVGRGTLVVKR